MIEERGPGRLDADRRAWCLFDFANSAFNTVVITFLYAKFFAQSVGDAPEGGGLSGDTLWSSMLTVSGLVVAFAAPWFGVVADHQNQKRRFLVGFSVVCILCTAGLAWPEPGASAWSTWLALGLVFVANTAFELAFVFYNAFLPQMASGSSAGRLSGRAWALGYVGGLLCLVGSLVAVTLAEEGTVGVTIRWLMLGVAVWFAVFGYPMLAKVRDVGPPNREKLPFRQTFTRLKGVIRTLPSYPDMLKLLLARLVYNDAVIALIGLAALYMDRTLEMSANEVLVTGIGLNVFAGLGAWGFANFDGRVGARPTVLISLVLMIGGAGLALAVPTKVAFWVGAVLIGIGLGPNQSASRSLMARFLPAGRSAEYYGLFALSGKATVWMGPLFYTVLMTATGDQRLALTPLIGMFVVGLVLLLTVNESRGSARALEG